MTGLLIAMAAAAATLVLLHDWRLAVPLLLASDLLRSAWFWQAARLPQGRATLAAAELVTAVAVAAILLLTASRTLYAVRRRSSPLRAGTLAALAAAGALATFAARVYPLSGDQTVDAASLFAVLCSLLVLLTARDVLKLYLGLLLLAGGAKLLYFGAGTRLLVLHVALWETASLALALVAAAFCSLLYGRLFTTELSMEN